MRIATLTTQYAPNYGALLQAYALQEYLSQNHDVMVINYIPDYSIQGWKAWRKVNGVKDFLRNIYGIINFKVFHDRNMILKKDRDFINTYLNLTDVCYNEDDIVNKCSGFDAFICGSDQIWNMTRHNNPINFLYFTRYFSDVRKISYAPSVADPIPEIYSKDLTNYLQNLDYISVREAADVKQIIKYTNKTVVDVCDPVFLWDGEYWKRKAVKNYSNEPYIMCYFMATNDVARKAVSKIRDLTGMKVLYVNCNDRDRIHADINCTTCGPLDFIGYIEGAEYVCTNSFHCAAFSIIFRKNLSIITKSTANTRLENLVLKTGLNKMILSEQTIEKLTLEDLEIDYSQSEDRINEWIVSSKEYLSSALS